MHHDYNPKGRQGAPAREAGAGDDGAVGAGTVAGGGHVVTCKIKLGGRGRYEYKLYWVEALERVKEVHHHAR